MKKILFLILCCLCLVGCSDKMSNNEIEQNNGKENIDNTLMANKYTFCYLYSKSKQISWSFYYDSNYNIIEDFTLISTTYNSLSEAIENEINEKEKCNIVVDGIECSVHRSNATVDVGLKNLKPNYNYYDKITELENNNWNCEELDRN